MHPLLQLQNDNRLYFKTALKIKDKNAEIITFETNDSQDKLLGIIEGHYIKHPDSKTRPTLYIVILKARQQGMSTATEGVFFKAITIGMPGDTPYQKTAMVISYDEDSAQTINEMSDRFYQHLPQEIKPMKRNSRGKGLILENPTNVQAEFEKNPGLQSKFLIDTANNLFAGSGKTMNYVHISELSKWSKPKETMKSLLQAVPKNNAIVIVESTANGAGDAFHELWQQAEAGENDFIPIFLPWFTHKEYSDRFYAESDKIALAQSLDDEEKQLVRLFQLSLEQLNWRRNTIKNKCSGSIETFHQEYPSTAEEAFLTSGRPRFDIPALREYLAQCKDGQMGYLERVGGQIKFIPDPKGYLEVWTKPNKSLEHYIGADVSKGLITGDLSAAPVFDNKNDLNALWHGRIDPDLFAQQLTMLGTWYGEALVAVEENNHGLTVLNSMKNDYINLYKRTNYNKVTEEEKQELGWWTSEQTKKLAIDNLARLIRERKLGIKSKRFIQECMTYVIDEKGFTNAQQGSYDDIVMAAAIILYIMETYAVPVADIVHSGTLVAHSGHGDNWTRRTDGTMVHNSEIKDQRKDEVDDWARGWFN
jgi:hypothetical protein